MALQTGQFFINPPATRTGHQAPTALLPLAAIYATQSICISTIIQILKQQLRWKPQRIIQKQNHTYIFLCSLSNSRNEFTKSDVTGEERWGNKRKNKQQENCSRRNAGHSYHYCFKLAQVISIHLYSWCMLQVKNIHYTLKTRLACHIHICWNDTFSATSGSFFLSPKGLNPINLWSLYSYYFLLTMPT